MADSMSFLFNNPLTDGFFCMFWGVFFWEGLGGWLVDWGARGILLVLVDLGLF